MAIAIEREVLIGDVQMLMNGVTAKTYSDIKLRQAKYLVLYQQLPIIVSR